MDSDVLGYIGKRVPMARPDLTETEIEHVNIALRNGWISQGFYVAKAEELLETITGRKYALCCSSGTMALIVALMAICPDQKSRNYVIAAPAMTFAAVHNAIKLNNGVIVYTGADARTWQIPRHELEGMQVDALIHAPCYGMLGSLSLATTAAAALRYVIEDASESFGGAYDNRVKAGHYGLISCISFYANKIVTAGEGGAILTDDEALYKTMRLIINHGIADKTYEPQRVGLNGRMTDLQAAVLYGQLIRMPDMIRHRNDILNEYNAAALDAGWMLPALSTKDEKPAPWVFAGMPADKQKVIDKADELNVEWRPFFPIPRDVPNTFTLATARTISKRGIMLPLSSALTDEEVERVMEVIRATAD